MSDVKDASPKPNVPFGPSVWFSLSEGRNDNASPRYLLPMICKAGNITKSDVGAIRIADDVTYIEIRESSVSGFLDAIGPEMKIEGTKDIVQLDTAPDFQALPRQAPNGAQKAKEVRRKPGKNRLALPNRSLRRREKRRNPSLLTRQKPKPNPARQPQAGKKPSRRPKGPPPPKGKPSSKKNRARAAAAKGGNAVPRRPK